FTYELLPTIVEKLQPMEEAEPDIALPAAKPAVNDRQAKLAQFAASEAQSLELVENINYTTGAWEVPDDARATLDQIAATMQQYSELSLKISSHTDARGPEKDNLALSKKRAEAALQYLQQQGIAPGRLSSEGLGESQLINRCKDGVECPDEEHAKNRRTEFRFSR
ncbi:MAG: OmpA family protein, partial [Bacteroidota bacterium]